MDGNHLRHPAEDQAEPDRRADVDPADIVELQNQGRQPGSGKADDGRGAVLERGAGSGLTGFGRRSRFRDENGY